MSDVLSTLANVKQWIGVASTNDDALLTRMLTAASAMVENYLNRALLTATYTETRDGNGSARLMLKAYPVTAVVSLSVDGQAVPPAPNAQTVGFQLANDAIVLRGSCFTRDLANVIVSYTAGYDTVPPDVEQAVLELVGLRYKERDRIGSISKSIGGETVSFTQLDMTASIKTALADYRRVVPL